MQKKRKKVIIADDFVSFETFQGYHFFPPVDVIVESALICNNVYCSVLYTSVYKVSNL